MHGHAPASAVVADAILALPFAFALVFYGCGVVIQSRHSRGWPWYRSLSWFLGVVAAASGFVGPLAAASHDGFVAHMWAHLLVGMAAPLLLVLGAPVTLALRSLHVIPARRLARLMRSLPARVLTLPVVAVTLNVGGMWMLYATPLYEAVQQSPVLHFVVMTHFLLAGYLFTASIVPVDPAPHRAGFPLRMTVLILALAAHGILAKTLYSHPPTGVSAVDAQAGAMLMYYAGDVIDAAIILLLCAQWYRASGRNLARSPRRAPVTTLG